MKVLSCRHPGLCASHVLAREGLRQWPSLNLSYSTSQLHLDVRDVWAGDFIGTKVSISPPNHLWTKVRNCAQDFKDWFGNQSLKTRFFGFSLCFEESDLCTVSWKLDSLFQLLTWLIFTHTSRNQYCKLFRNKKTHKRIKTKVNFAFTSQAYFCDFLISFFVRKISHLPWTGEVNDTMEDLNCFQWYEQ